MLISFPSFEYSRHMAELSLLGKTVLYSKDPFRSHLPRVIVESDDCSWDARTLKIFEAPSQELLFYLFESFMSQKQRYTSQT